MKYSLPFNYQLRIYISKLEKRTGVCSQIYEEPDKHILLWDFDNANLTHIISSLKCIQLQYSLPEILITESSPDNYHAYCFSAQSLRETIKILSSVPEIDIAYLRLGMVRGYYTLRISSRVGEKIKLVKRLPSNHKSTVDWPDITINEYLTSNKGGHNNA